MRTQPIGFDPADSYVVSRPFTFNGVALNPGDPVPGMEERRLRIFFETRKIRRSPRPALTVPLSDTNPQKAKGKN